MGRYKVMAGNKYAPRLISQEITALSILLNNVEVNNRIGNS